MPVGFANKQQDEVHYRGLRPLGFALPDELHLHISGFFIHMDTAGTGGDGSSVRCWILDQGEALPLAPGRNYHRR